MEIRKAGVDDLSAITEIYNQAILSTVATFDTQPKTIEDQLKWFSAHDPKHPILVAEAVKTIIGWASLSEWSDRCAYSETAEMSVYVHASFRGQGIGKELKIALIEEAKKLGMHTILSRVTGSNEPSIRLNEKLGFSLIGTMREVGKKFDKRHDVHLYQLILNTHCAT